MTFRKQMELNHQKQAARLASLRSLASLVWIALKILILRKYKKSAMLFEKVGLKYVLIALQMA